MTPGLPKARIPQHSGVDSPRKVPEFVDGDAEILDCAAERRSRRRFGLGINLSLRQLQCQGDGDKPLLCAVVQVTFDPTALRVAFGEQPPTRVGDLIELRLNSSLQLLVVDRQPYGRSQPVEQPGVFEQHRVVHQGGDWLGTAANECHRAIGTRPSAIRQSDVERNIAVLAKTDQVRLPAGKAFTVEGVCVNDVAGRARLTMRINGNQVLETTRSDPLDNGVPALQAWTYPRHSPMDIHWHEFSVRAVTG